MLATDAPPQRLNEILKLSLSERQDLISALSPEDAEIFLDELRALFDSDAANSIDHLFPPDGPVRRELYIKHMEFFEKGQKERERAFMAANRIGKTMSAGGYEVACHLTGVYPPWWPGRRWDRPVRVWAAGDTGETVREIIQPVLFGQAGAIGTGLIRANTLGRMTSKRGVPDTVESARIEHSSGGLSTLLFKSYEQGRKAFQGTKMDLIWLDEEPSMAIYSECLLRTAATSPDGSDWGSILCTFTPLLGISEVVMHFLGTDWGADVMDTRPKLDPVSVKRDLMGGPEQVHTPRVLTTDLSHGDQR